VPVDRADAETEFWAALAAADRPRAQATVAALLDDEGWSAHRVLDELVVPSQARVGELWLTGEWSVAQEHAATGVNESVVHWLTSRLVPPGEHAPTILVSCLQGERHALPALVLAHDLMALGANVMFLGADPEPSGLLSAILSLRPRAVLFSASLTSSLSNQRMFFHGIASVGIPLVVGGRAFGGRELGSRRAAALGATAYAETAQEVLDLLAELPVRLPTPDFPELGAADDDAEWLDHYGRRIVPEIMWTLGQRHGDPDEVGSRWPEVSQHIEHVLGCLAASVSTRDESIMLEVRDWLVEVLAHRGIDPALVDEIWDLLAGPLQGHPVARVFLAASRRPAENVGA
jgi:methanogenic corrinoid protein MtbC1